MLAAAAASTRSIPLNWPYLDTRKSNPKKEKKKKDKEKY
uniref:Uncharacterized protein n=1 Tax=Rhizophora mucronata TaxID=61149 RepID=A0A2P2K1J7_RHIMU